MLADQSTSPTRFRSAVLRSLNGRLLLFVWMPNMFFELLLVFDSALRDRARVRQRARRLLHLLEALRLHPLPHRLRIRPRPVPKTPLTQAIAGSDGQRCNGSRQQWWTGDSCGCAREGLQPPRQRGRLQLRRRLAQLADQRRCLRARQRAIVRLLGFRGRQTVGGFERGGQLLGRILEPSRPARKSAP